MAKLPGFKEREGTSMSGAFMTPQIAPNVKEHRAAKINYVPATDPNDALQMAAAENAQWSNISKTVNTVMDFGIKIFQAKDTMNAEAMSQGINSEMTLWVNDELNNRDLEEQDEYGNTVRPWDNWEERYQAKYDEVQAKYESKYKVYGTENKHKLSLDKTGYDTKYRESLADRKRQMDILEGQRSGYEAVANAPDFETKRELLAKMTIEGYITPTQEAAQVQQYGAEDARLRVFRSLEAATPANIHEVAQSLMNDQRNRRYLNDADLEKQVRTHADNTIQKGVENSVYGWLESNPHDYDGALSMIDELEMSVNYYNNEDKRSKFSALRNKVIDLQEDYKQQVSEDVDTAMEYAERQNAYLTGQGLTDDKMDGYIADDTKLLMEQARLEGKELSADQARRIVETRLLTSGVFNRTGVLGSSVRNQLDVGNEYGNAEMVRAGMVLRKTFQDHAPNAIAKYDADGENIYEYLESQGVEPDAPLSVIEGHVNHYRGYKGMKESEKTEYFNNFKVAVGGKEKIAEWDEGTLEGRYDYDDVFGEAGWFGSDTSAASWQFRSEYEQKRKEFAVLSKSRPMQARKQLQQWMDKNYTPTEINGKIVPIKGRPQEEFSNLGTNQREVDLISGNVDQQEQLLLTGEAMTSTIRQNPEGYMLLASSQKTADGRKQYFVVNKETMFPMSYEDRNHPLYGKHIAVTMEDPRTLMYPPEVRQNQIDFDYAENIRPNIDGLLSQLDSDGTPTYFKGENVPDLSNFATDEPEGKKWLYDNLLKGMEDKAVREGWSQNSAKKKVWRGHIMTYMQREHGYNVLDAQEHTRPSRNRNWVVPEVDRAFTQDIYEEYSADRIKAQKKRGTRKSRRK